MEFAQKNRSARQETLAHQARAFRGWQIRPRDLPIMLPKLWLASVVFQRRA